MRPVVVLVFLLMLVPSFSGLVAASETHTFRTTVSGEGFVAEGNVTQLAGTVTTGSIRGILLPRLPVPDARVEIFVNGAKLGDTVTDVAGRFKIEWTAWSAGSYAFVARATINGETATSKPWAMVVVAPPDPPTVKVSQMPNANALLLEWVPAPDSYATTYFVFEETAGGTLLLGESSGSTTSYVHPVPVHTEHNYTIRTVNIAGTSAPSDVVGMTSGPSPFATSLTMTVMFTICLYMLHGKPCGEVVEGGTYTIPHYAEDIEVTAYATGRLMNGTEPVGWARVAGVYPHRGWDADTDGDGYYRGPCTKSTECLRHGLYRLNSGSCSWFPALDVQAEYDPPGDGNEVYSESRDAWARVCRASEPYWY